MRSRVDGDMIFLSILILAVLSLVGYLLWDISESDNFSYPCEVIEVGIVEGRTISSGDTTTYDPEYCYIKIKNKNNWHRTIRVNSIEGIRVGDLYLVTNWESEKMLHEGAGVWVK